MKKITFCAALLSSMCCLPLLSAMEKMGKTEVGAEYDPKNGLLGLKRDSIAKLMSKERNVNSVRNVYAISQVQQPWLLRQPSKLVAKDPFTILPRLTNNMQAIVGDIHYLHTWNRMTKPIYDDPTKVKRVKDLALRIHQWVKQIPPDIKNGDNEYIYGYQCLRPKGWHTITIAETLQQVAEAMQSAYSALSALQLGTVSEASIKRWSAQYCRRTNTDNVRAEVKTSRAPLQYFINRDLGYLHRLNECLRQLKQNVQDEANPIDLDDEDTGWYEMPYEDTTIMGDSVGEKNLKNL